MERGELVEELYNAYQGYMYHIALDMLQDRQLAEDAVIESAIRLLRAKALDIESITDTSTKSLVRIVVKNVSARLYHKYIERQYRTDSIDLLKLGEDNDGMLFLEVKDFLDRIPSIYRDIAILRIYYGYEYEAIGKLLRIHKQTAKNRMVTLRKLINLHWIGGDAFEKSDQEKNRRGTLSIR